LIVQYRIFPCSQGIDFYLTYGIIYTGSEILYKHSHTVTEHYTDTFLNSQDA